MDYVNKLLDKAKQLSSSATDMALAEKLHLTRTAVSNYRHGRALPDTITCAKLSEITGEPLPRVLGNVGEARAISNEEKRVWRRLAQVAVLIMCTLPITSVFASSSGFTSYSLYIMSICASAAFIIVSLNSTDESNHRTATTL